MAQIMQTFQHCFVLRHLCMPTPHLPHFRTATPLTCGLSDNCE